MRLRICCIHVDDIARLSFNGGQEILTENGMPENAQFTRAFFDHETNCICLVFEHESFEEACPGLKIKKTLAQILEQYPQAGG